MNPTEQETKPEQTPAAPKILIPQQQRILLPSPSHFRMALLTGTILTLTVLGTFSSLSYLQGSNQIAAVEQAVTPAPVDPFADLELLGRAAYVFDTTTGEALYEKSANEQLPLASLTKLALALVVGENLQPDQFLEASADALATEGESGLYPGQLISVHDLTELLLVPSSNDAAAVLAEGLATPLLQTYDHLANDSTPAVTRMNERVHELGLNSMYFVNPSGLDASVTMSGGYGSARDVSRLLAHLAAKHPEIIAGTAYPEVYTNANGTTVTNTNSALPEIPGLIGGKTGFTDLAGGNLAVIFDAGINHPVAVVVLGSTQQGRFQDVEALVAAAQERIRQSVAAN